MIYIYIYLILYNTYKRRKKTTVIEPCVPGTKSHIRDKYDNVTDHEKLTVDQTCR